MTADEAVDITSELARGKFTDEMLNDMRARIGLELRTDGCVNNEDATRLAILRFCEGNGSRPFTNRVGIIHRAHRRRKLCDTMTRGAMPRPCPLKFYED